jgi:UDP-glucose 4-epimerase
VDETVVPELLTPYAVSKFAAEHYVSTLGIHYGIETVALRVFNAYGPGQALPPAYPPVVPHFIHQILSGGTVVLYGSGEQTRDYVYIDDVIDALIVAGEQANIDHEVINIGSGVEISVAGLVAAIEKVSGRRAHVLQNKEQSGGVKRLVADLEKAQKLLDYQPKVTLLAGLEHTIRQDSRFQR